MCTLCRHLWRKLHFVFFALSLSVCVYRFTCPWSSRHIYSWEVNRVCARTRLWITCNICCWNLERKKRIQNDEATSSYNELFSPRPLALSFFLSLLLCFNPSLYVRRCCKTRKNKRTSTKPFIFANGTTINMHTSRMSDGDQRKVSLSSFVFFLFLYRAYWSVRSPFFLSFPLAACNWTQGDTEEKTTTTIALKLLRLQLIFYSVNVRRVVLYTRSTDIVSHIEETITERIREREQ